MPAVLDTLTAALAPRGGDPGTWHTDDRNKLRPAKAALGLGLRAAVPEIKTRAGTAIVIDGIAEATTLLGKYAEHGPRALLTGTDPYAMALADPDRGLLVLARNGDGPPLYYAVHHDTVLVASEPSALFAAGVQATPDPAVIERFLGTGACDDQEATFYSGVRRVLPGQVIAVAKDGIEPLMVRPSPMRAVAPATALLRTAAATGNVGVRLAEGVAGAAALATSNTNFVYSASFAPLETGEEAYAAKLIDRQQHSSVPAGPDQIEHDLDAFLADLGEPVPDLTGYLIWATARAAAGEVDALIDPAGANLLLTAGERMPANAQRTAATAYLSRVADRCATRFGVAIRAPYAEAIGSGDTLRKELAGLARQGELAGADQLRHPAPTRELLLALRGRIYAALLAERFAARPWADQRTVLAGFQGLVRGRRADAEYFWRLYLVERWIRTLDEPPASATPRAAFEPNRGHLLEQDGWLRFPVRTAVIGDGERIVEKVRWYVTEFTQQLTADKFYRKVLGQQWFAVVAAKPVSVAQGRARYLWEIMPGLPARVLTARGDGVRRGPWRTQLAIEASGLGRVVCAGGLRVMGLRSLAYKVGGPALRAVTIPREDAVYPADVAVIPPPGQPDELAAAMLNALRTGLPADVYATFGGIAIVSGAEVLGFAGPGTFPHAALADDPLGSSREQTPIAILTQPVTAPRPTKKDKTRRGVPAASRR
ncbi:hypothetical protein [Longispora albida]|uniref:hypothetical protein n=1 Tax=Longispora albida TaxID=203523 RepID=UPI000376F2FF|nr:hypothetical protein [Longispora albida]